MITSKLSTCPTVHQLQSLSSLPCSNRSTASRMATLPPHMSNLLRAFVPGDLHQFRYHGFRLQSARQPKHMLRSQLQPLITPSTAFPRPPTTQQTSRWTTPMTLRMTMMMTVQNSSLGMPTRTSYMPTSLHFRIQGQYNNLSMHHPSWSLPYLWVPLGLSDRVETPTGRLVASSKIWHFP